MSLAVQFGLVPSAFESPGDGTKRPWDMIRSQALAGEELDFYEDRVRSHRA